MRLALPANTIALLVYPHHHVQLAMLQTLELLIQETRSVSVWLGIIMMESKRNVQHVVINAKPVPIQLLACHAIRRGKGIRQQLNAHALLDIMIMVYLFARRVIIAAYPAQLVRNA